MSESDSKMVEIAQENDDYTSDEDEYANQPTYSPPKSRTSQLATIIPRENLTTFITGPLSASSISTMAKFHANMASINSLDDKTDRYFLLATSLHCYSFCLVKLGVYGVLMKIKQFNHW